MRPDPLSEKSYGFALEIVVLCQTLNMNRAYVLSKQLLRSGTSIGANIEEASQAQSKRDFISKLSISLKEAHETRFWLRLIRDAKILPAQQCDVLIVKAHEIIRILVASIKTAKRP